MAVEQAARALTPVTAFALIGVLGVGAQWVAWRFRMPAIVIMLIALTGPRGLVLVAGAGLFAQRLAEALTKLGMPVIFSDANRGRLLGARRLGIEVFGGDILSDAAEHQVELLNYRTNIAATENDACNILVATDFGPEFGRETCWQIARAKSENARHAPPAQLGGRLFAGART